MGVLVYLFFINNYFINQIILVSLLGMGSIKYTINLAVNFLNIIIAVLNNKIVFFIILKFRRKLPLVLNKFMIRAKLCYYLMIKIYFNFVLSNFIIILWSLLCKQ